jgi:hypothetical protein
VSKDNKKIRFPWFEFITSKNGTGLDRYGLSLRPKKKPNQTEQFWSANSTPACNLNSVNR